MPSKNAQAPRWYQAWRTAPRPAADTDPADLGTAFGLDLSMSEPAPLPVAATARRPGWVQRLAERRRSAP